jgi:uncharacterized protein
LSEQSHIVVDIWVTRDGERIEDHDINALSVSQDLGQPDMCVLVLNNEGNAISNQAKLGDAIEIKIGGESGEHIFQGEVVGIEPEYKAGGESKCVLRAFNRLHRLLRGRKSKTYLEESDQQIAQAVAQANGLSAECGSDTSITHEHVYQHNQTDLEFLRLRAARIGYEVWVEDRTLHFDKPKTDRDSGLALVFGEPGDGLHLISFMPRLSSAAVVEKVEVRGWNPEEKEEIVGTASSAATRLGSKTAVDETKGVFGSVVTYEVDHPIFSADEANAIAEARFAELRMSYITGEALCIGNPGFKPGVVIKITVNNDDEKDRFNGKYFIAGATHRFSQTQPGSRKGGYTALLRLNRDAEAGEG